MWGVAVMPGAASADDALVMTPASPSIIEAAMTAVILIRDVI
jgi:hypothetical protein